MAIHPHPHPHPRRAAAAPETLDDVFTSIIPSPVVPQKAKAGDGNVKVKKMDPLQRRLSMIRSRKRDLPGARSIGNGVKQADVKRKVEVTSELKTSKSIFSLILLVPRAKGRVKVLRGHHARQKYRSRRTTDTIRITRPPAFRRLSSKRYRIRPSRGHLQGRPGVWLNPLWMGRLML